MKVRAAGLAVLASAALLGGCAYPQPYPVYDTRPAVAQRSEFGVVERIEMYRGGSGAPVGLGAIVGGIAGGIIGHQFGGGTGKTAMTAVGAVGGGIAGKEIEKNMKKHTVWITTVTLKNGSKHRYESEKAPAVKAGDVVTIENGHPVKHSS